MTKCSNKLKYNCGTRTNSRCVFYDLEVPSFSSLVDEECLTIEETTNDIYDILEEVKDSLDLNNLGQDCITYQKEEEDLKVREALLQHEKEICELKNNTTSSNECCIDINEIDTSCLVDECNTGFTNQTQLIQALINKVCELEAQINSTP